MYPINIFCTRVIILCEQKTLVKTEICDITMCIDLLVLYFLVSLCRLQPDTRVVKKKQTEGPCRQVCGDISKSFNEKNG